MTKETLQQLIGVHNTLHSIQVTGDSIIPMAQVLMALRSMINEQTTEEKDEPPKCEKVEAVFA